MRSEPNVATRMEALIARGSDVLAKRRQTGGYSVLMTDDRLYAGWRTQAMHALTSLLGESHTYTQAFKAQVRPEASHEFVDMGIGILQAVHDDALAGDLLTTMAGVISGEIFSDFLEMAAHLLDNHYFHPAASLTGAVLEDGLRRIATANGVNSSGNLN